MAEPKKDEPKSARGIVGGFLGGVVNDVKDGNLSAKDLAKGVIQMGRDFKTASAAPAPETDPEYVVRYDKSVPGAKPAGKKAAPAKPTTVSEYYRVDESKGQMTARKLEAAEITPEIRQLAKTPKQLQDELAAANTPDALRIAKERAEQADELVGEAKKGPKVKDYERDKKRDAKVEAVVQNGTPAEAREAIIGDLKTTQKDLKGVKDTGDKPQMTPADKENLSTAIQGDIDNLKHLQGIPAALETASQLANPAPTPAAAPKVDPLAPKH